LTKNHKINPFFFQKVVITVRETKFTKLEGWKCKKIPHHLLCNYSWGQASFVTRNETWLVRAFSVCVWCVSHSETLHPLLLLHKNKLVGGPWMWKIGALTTEFNITITHTQIGHIQIGPCIIDKTWTRHVRPSIQYFLINKKETNTYYISIFIIGWDHLTISYFNNFDNK
jgi:hypothetical protein